jgi:plastocyanin
MRIVRYIVPAIVAAVVALPGSAAWAQETSVSIIDNEFDPSSIDVEEGTTVTWTNNGDSPHTVTASDDDFSSGNLDPGDSYSQTFDEAGEFDYICEYHEDEGMTGTVIVSAASGNGDTDPTDTPDTEPTDDSLPETGADIWPFLYVAGVFILAGGACLRLDRST